LSSFIQVYKSVRRFTKANYNPSSRSQFAVWENEFFSKAGYWKEGTLYLNAMARTNISLENKELIILQEEPKLKAQEPTTQEVGELHSFQQLTAPQAYEIFYIKRSEKGFSIHLNYDDHSMNIGIPKRSNHKIADLRRGEAIRYRINGKSDFSLSRGKERSFTELDYIIYYQGEIERLVYLASNKIETRKGIPLQSIKEVDERKFLS